MPEFVSVLVSAILFCIAVIVLNGLTRLAIQFHFAPSDLGEDGFLQFGIALALSHLAWRRMVHRRLA